VIAKPGVRLLERGARTLHDGIDRAARETATEELAHELRSVASQSGQRSRCRRCSLRMTAVGGNSAT